MDDKQAVPACREIRGAADLKSAPNELGYAPRHGSAITNENGASPPTTWPPAQSYGGLSRANRITSKAKHGQRGRFPR